MPVERPAFHIGVTQFRNQLGMDWSDFGGIEILDSPDRDIVTRIRRRGASASLYRWTPADCLSDQLPAGYCVDLICAELDDGLRRFTIAQTGQDFIDLTAPGGLAILNLCRDLSAEQRSSYRALFHFFQRLRGTREHLSRNFNYSRDLFIQPSQRLPESDRYVLPDDLGKTLDGKGHAWTVEELTRTGREAAISAGVQNAGQPVNAGQKA